MGVAGVLVLALVVGFIYVVSLVRRPFAQVSGSASLAESLLSLPRHLAEERALRAVGHREASRSRARLSSRTLTPGSPSTRLSKLK